MKFLLTDLETKRLKFRLFNAHDSEKWLPFFKDRSIWKYFNLDETKTEEEINSFWWAKCKSRYEKDLGGLMAVTKKDSGLLLGMCGLLVQQVDGKQRLEVGYSFLPEARGFGYATEAAVFAKNQAFTMGYDKEFFKSVVSVIHRENTASAAVAKRNQMTVESQIKIDQHLFDIYSIKRNTWLASHGT